MSSSRAGFASVRRAVRGLVVRRVGFASDASPVGGAVGGPTCRYPGARSFALLPGRLLPFAGSGRSGFLVGPDQAARSEQEATPAGGTVYL